MTHANTPISGLQILILGSGKANAESLQIRSDFYGGLSAALF